MTSDVTRLEAHEVVDLSVVQVPEGRKIFPQMTVTENLRMGSFIRRRRKKRDRKHGPCFSDLPPA